MTKVKICGITNIEDALCAKKYGADFIGFIFYPKSPRYIEPKRAYEIIKNLENIKTVGVFVDEDVHKINDIRDYLNLDFVQLHGFEDEKTIENLNSPYIKNIRSIDDIEKYKSASIYLLDAADTIHWGGTGNVADWSLAKKIKENINKEKPFMLSGGLKKENIKEAIYKVEPDIIDLSSSLEYKAGKKDHTLIKEFFEELKTLEIKNND